MPESLCQTVLLCLNCIQNIVVKGSDTIYNFNQTDIELEKQEKFHKWICSVTLMSKTWKET